MIPWRRKKTQKDKDSDITLADIIRGLQYCVNSSQQIAGHQQLADIDNFIDEENKPYKRTLKINEQAAMDVPLICMFNHNNLILDEMEVNLELVIKNMALKVPEEALNSKSGRTFINSQGDQAEESNDSYMPRTARGFRQSGEDISSEYLSRTSFAVDLDSAKLSGKNTHLGLKLKFKSGNTPEALSRVIEKLNGQIAVYNFKEKQPDE